MNDNELLQAIEERIEWHTKRMGSCRLLVRLYGRKAYLVREAAKHNVRAKAYSRLAELLEDA